MKILITGASGFIGSRLLEEACHAFGESNVVAFSSKPIDRCACIVHGSSGDWNLNEHDAELIASVETVIHAGAYTPKTSADANVIGGCNGNILFTEKLLGLRFDSLKKIIYLSTLDVYEQADLTTESTPTRPATLYGLSKLYCERMISVFAEQEHIGCHVLRIGHVYGPGEEKYGKFLPKAIRNIIDNAVVELWGDGSEMRSFIYIDDVVKSVVNAVGLRENVGVINVVSGVALSIRQLVEKLALISEKPFQIVIREFNGPKRDYIFDNKKLKTHLLESETDFDSGLLAEYRYMASLR